MIDAEEPVNIYRSLNIDFQTINKHKLYLLIDKTREIFLFF